MSTLSHTFEPPRFPAGVPESAIREQNLRLRYILQLTLNEIEEHRKLVQQYAKSDQSLSSRGSLAGVTNEVHGSSAVMKVDSNGNEASAHPPTPARRSQRMKTPKRGDQRR
ncbi:hypothetical protein EYR40_008169 [Pleurotus pulmonarius]|nr:hypothetical protein EYR38_007518 [Pleurotus pulmonarius]KAF4597704.1 hypothetical protein EYR40_008169 [Pleurotus pulmonarius]